MKKKKKLNKAGKILAVIKKVKRKSKKALRTGLKTPISVYGSRIHKAVAGTKKIVRVMKPPLMIHVSPEGSKGKPKVKRPVGRPPGAKLRVNPLTGKVQRIPAVEYYKLLKAAKRKRKLIATQIQQQRAQTMIKRGIPPEMANQIVRTRMIREIQRGVSSIPQIRQIPIQPVRQPQVRVVTDIMTGKKIIKPILPKEKWIE